MGERASAGADRQLVVFRVGEEEFGADIMSVQEIVRLDSITRIPHAPKWVEGVVNLRGEVLPVIDLRRRFGIPLRPYDEATRVVVAVVEGERIGLVVDGVSEVLRIPSPAARPAPPVVAQGRQAEFVDGVAVLDDGRRMVLLVAVDRLLPEDREEAARTLESIRGAVPAAAESR